MNKNKKKAILNNTTRILVTHGITYLPKTDYIIVMKDGAINEQGTYEELIAQKGEFAAFMLEYMSEENEDVAQIKEELTKSLGEEFLSRHISAPKSDDMEESLPKKRR